MLSIPCRLCFFERIGIGCVPSVSSVKVLERHGGAERAERGVEDRGVAARGVEERGVEARGVAERGIPSAEARVCLGRPERSTLLLLAPTLLLLLLPPGLCSRPSSDDT